MDCMQGMKEFPDKYFELAICDPPYGIGIDGQKLNINKKNPKYSRKEHEKRTGMQAFHRRSISENWSVFQSIRLYGEETTLLSI